MRPLGDTANQLLGALSEVRARPAAEQVDVAGRIVTQAFEYSGGGALRERQRTRHHVTLRPERHHPSLGKLDIDVQFNVHDLDNLHRAYEGAARRLAKTDADNALLLYTLGPRRDELVLDFKPGPVRFSRIDEFLEALRTKDLAELLAALREEHPRIEPAHGVVRWVDEARGIGVIAPEGEDRTVYMQGPYVAGRDLHIGTGDRVAFELDFHPEADEPHAEAVNVEPVPPAADREIGVWVAGDGGVPDSPPVQAGVPRRLNFKVGQPMAGSLVHGAEARIPEGDIPPTGLDTTWLVTADGLDFHAQDPVAAVPNEAGRGPGGIRFALHVPAHGESATVSVVFTPTRAGTATLYILIQARGEAYRRLTAELQVGEAAPSGPLVAIQHDARLARADQLALPPPHEWQTPEGKLEIIVHRDQAIVSGTLGPGRTLEPRFVAWTATAVNVAGPIDDVRRSVNAFRDAHGDDYLDAIDPRDLATRLDEFQPSYHWFQLPGLAAYEHRNRWEAVRNSDELAQLAYHGRVLFESLFPRDGELHDWLRDLSPGHLVKLVWTPTGGEQIADVPWGLMYLLEPSKPIDPMGFAGLRFRLGYRADDPSGTVDGALGRLDQVRAACCLFWGDEERTAQEASLQREAFVALSNRVVIPAAPGAPAKQEVLRVLQDADPPPCSILYFFCHYGTSQGRRVLRFGDSPSSDDVVSEADIPFEPAAGSPLVFANACGTGAEDPYHAGRLAARLSQRGCRAFLGTEVEVPTRLAGRFATVFFHFLLRRADPEPIAAGEAVAQARLFLWTRYRNIGGLFYTYRNLYELYVASRDELPAA
jgi:cold shock CspA family protein